MRYCWRVWLQCFLPLTYLCRQCVCLQVTNTQSTSQPWNMCTEPTMDPQSCQGWHSLGLSCPGTENLADISPNLLVTSVCEVLWMLVCVFDCFCSCVLICFCVLCFYGFCFSCCAFGVLPLAGRGVCWHWWVCSLLSIPLFVSPDDVDRRCTSILYRGHNEQRSPHGSSLLIRVQVHVLYIHGSSLLILCPGCLL